MTVNPTPDEEIWVTAKVQMPIADYEDMKRSGRAAPKIMTTTRYLGVPMDEDQIPAIVNDARRQLGMPTLKESAAGYRNWPATLTMEFLDLAARNWTPGDGERPGSWDGTNEDAEEALATAGKGDQQA